MKTYPTNYHIAVHWLNNSLVLCNNIAEIDESVYDNMRFRFYDSEDKNVEISQWFITDCSESDVEYLEKTFGLKFTFSDKLGCFILCVGHGGTSLDYVYCDTNNEYAMRELGERE